MADTESSRLDGQSSLRILLAHLSNSPFETDGWFEGWRVVRVNGGRNNVLYRVTGDADDFAIKFTIRDARDRAGREFGSLTALQQAGLSLGPMPVLLDRESYTQPVVVQTWLTGEVSGDVPTTDAAWDKIVRHLASVHAVKPEHVDVPLRMGTLDMRSVAEGRKVVQEHVVHIPLDEQSADLCEVLRQFDAAVLPEWDGKITSLVRLDNNILNYVRRPGLWLSVDWENSGWGDPAFDVSNLITHAAYLDVPQERWDWVVERYCALVDDSTACLRIQSYTTIMLVWWVVRMARYLYEIPRGLDPRLVSWSDAWLSEMQQKYARYVALARWKLDTGCSMLDTGCSIVDAR